MFDSQYPYFISLMHARRLNHSHTVYVPAKFARSYLPACPDLVSIRDEKDCTWSVCTILKDGKVVSFNNGWQFVKEGMTLCAGDVCAFEMIEPTLAVLKLTVFCVGDYV
ncbi:hypothetical protein ACH5RR_012975 [Cinchona calisaya]|uniref:TF-B3 domain-containing protein n=1 Tax=Cinchona calisaya TaxID=153742 RepID=A0ABD3A032_9GENT